MSTANRQCLLRRALLAASDRRCVENTPLPATTVQNPSRYGPDGSRYDMSRLPVGRLFPEHC